MCTGIIDTIIGTARYLLRIVLICLFMCVVAIAVDFLEENNDTDGITIVYPENENYIWVGADNERITLINNDTARAATKDEVLEFIMIDQTDKNPYTDNYKCGDFAEDVHNNAEAAGLKCGWVSIDGIDHACNAFETTDAGIIFIDCTPVTIDTFAEIEATMNGYTVDYGEWDGTNDAIVKLKEGSKYRSKTITNGHYLNPMGTVESFEIYW